MLKLKKKDQKIRQHFFIKEKMKNINKFLFINFLSKKNYKKKIKSKISFFFFTLNKFYNKISRTNIKSRCLLTNRGRSINKSYGLSRIFLRNFMQFGIISGYKKSFW
jgi:ribosomal protein S14